MNKEVQIDRECYQESINIKLPAFSVKIIEINFSNFYLYWNLDPFSSSRDTIPRNWRKKKTRSDNR